MFLRTEGDIRARPATGSSILPGIAVAPKDDNPNATTTTVLRFMCMVRRYDLQIGYHNNGRGGSYAMGETANLMIRKLSGRSSPPRHRMRPLAPMACRRSASRV